MHGETNKRNLITIKSNLFCLLAIITIVFGLFLTNDPAYHIFDLASGKLRETFPRKVLST